ncbi:MAG: CZB domain-containing protein [Bacteriovoracaceae bacterium]|nr:CZB domain-containing protein [Bacteriovoracaceae bacterium]
MGANLDICMARNVHLNWEMELEAIVHGGKKDIKLQSYNDCELGVWLHTTALDTYKEHDSTRHLVDIHKHFHMSAKEVVASLKQQDQDKAKLHLQEVRNMSREIISLLTDIELRSLERQNKGKKPTKARNLLLRLFEGPFSAMPEDFKVLDVSHARLVHLRWARDLTKTFGSRGKNVCLQSANNCALGAWIKDVGLKIHPNIDEIEMLDSVHQSFHKKAESTIHNLIHKRDARADHAYLDMLWFSRETIYLLSLIEFKLLNSDTIFSTQNLLDSSNLFIASMKKMHLDHHGGPSCHIAK